MKMKTRTILALTGLALLTGCASPEVASERYSDKIGSRVRVLTDEEMAQIRGCPEREAKILKQEARRTLYPLKPSFKY